MDGEIGKVDEFLVDPDTMHVTHIVMREGHLWETKEISIPISMVQHISEKRVYLNVDKAQVAQLPEIPVQRKYQWNQL
ncbi:MAG: PRC-barrel domain-containing protein [Anaerolineales bacterium]|nr:PRC-barrel domain-containing protein [Anaerolineales bacterium]